jgi:hypothetical protein
MPESSFLSANYSMVQLKWPNGLHVSRRPFENQHQLIEKTFVKIASLECSPTAWR